MYNKDKINEAIGRKQLTNTALAELADVSRPTIQEIRSGEFTGTLTTLEKVLRVLDLTLADVFTEAA